jgi:hypothetical protein
VLKASIIIVEAGEELANCEFLGHVHCSYAHEYRKSSYLRQGDNPQTISVPATLITPE